MALSDLSGVPVIEDQIRLLTDQIDTENRIIKKLESVADFCFVSENSHICICIEAIYGDRKEVISLRSDRFPQLVSGLKSEIIGQAQKLKDKRACMIQELHSLVITSKG